MAHEHIQQQDIALDPNDERYTQVHRVTVVGSVIDLFLTVIKLLFGYIANSQALIADGVHSLSDLLTNIVVLIAAKQGSKKADAEHPYGHERFETVATVILGVVLAIVAVGIGWEATLPLIDGVEPKIPGAIALAIAAISVFSKEWVFHYTMRVAKAIKSPMLKANAWHARTDSISSVVVIIGVAGALLGYPFLDAIAAIVVAVMIGKVGYDLIQQSLSELVDTALESERVDAIYATARSVDGVRKVHNLRTRMMAGKALVDLHIQVGSYLSVSEAHFLGDRVREKIIDTVDEVCDVLVHIDPEDDREPLEYGHFPFRIQLESWVRQILADAPHHSAQLQYMRIHYLHETIELELQFDQILPDEIATLLRTTLTAKEPVQKVSVCYEQV